MRGRSLRVERLEDRRLLAFGDLLHTLANPTPAYEDYYGQEVSISGDLAIVGAPGDSVTGKDAGAAYVFQAKTGDLVATIANPATTYNDHFGRHVAISGNLAVVAAPYDVAGDFNRGVVYVFNATSGAMLTSLQSPWPSFWDDFGCSVAISGNTVVVGDYSNSDPEAGMGGGAAYLFDATTGSLLHTLHDPQPMQGAKFGYSVAISGNKVVVGAIGQSTSLGYNTGAAYVFDAGTGTLVSTLADHASAWDQQFG